MCKEPYEYLWYDTVFYVSCFLSSNLISHLNSNYLENEDYHVVDTLYIGLIELSFYEKKKHNCEWRVFKSLFVL